MLPDQVEPPLEALREPRVDHRAVQHVGGRIADRRLGHRLREPVDEVVVHVGVHDHGAERGAPLPGGAEPAEQRALDREVEVGVGHHDERVLAAELEARRLEVAAAQLADPSADVGRTGEADLVERRPSSIAPLQPRERRRPVGEHHLERALGEAGVQDQLRERLGRRGRVLGGLPHHGVPAQERRDQVPGRDRDREVARRHDRGDADRGAEREELLVGHLGRHGHAVEPPSLAEEEGAGVDDLLDLAARFPDRLADLAGDDPGERLGVVLHQPPELLDRPAAHGRRDRGPPRLRAASRAGRPPRTSPHRPGSLRRRSRPAGPGSGSSVASRGCRAPGSRSGGSRSAASWADGTPPCRPGGPHRVGGPGPAETVVKDRAPRSR